MKKPFVKTKEYVWHQIKIMWVEQVVGPPIDYITAINALTC